MKINKFTGSRPMSKRVVESLPIDEEVTKEEINDVGTASMISELIKKEWEICDLINGYKISIEEMANPEFDGLLDELLTDHYANIGQLEARVVDVVPEASAIDDGNEEEELRPKIEDEIINDEIEEPVEDEIELPSDDIPSDLLDDEEE